MLLLDLGLQSDREPRQVPKTLAFVSSQEPMPRGLESDYSSGPLTA